MNMAARKRAVSQHTPLYTYVREQTVCTCSCGWIGVRVTSHEAAQEQFSMHEEQARHFDATPTLEPVLWA